MSVTAAIRAFVEAKRKENELLERHAAEGDLAHARELLLRDLEDALAAHDEGTVTADEAAEITGCNVETVRRAVRNGEIADLRTNERGVIRVRQADLDYLRGKAKRAPRARTAASGAVARLARLG